MDELIALAHQVVGSASLLGYERWRIFSTVDLTEFHWLLRTSGIRRSSGFSKWNEPLNANKGVGGRPLRAARDTFHLT